MTMLLLLRNYGTSSIRRYAGTGAMVAVSSAQGSAQVRVYLPTAVYTTSVDDQNAEYVNLNRQGT